MSATDVADIYNIYMYNVHGVPGAFVCHCYLSLSFIQMLHIHVHVHLLQLLVIHFMTMSRSNQGNLTIL